MDDTGLHHAHDLPIYPPEEQIGAAMTMATTDACAANSSVASSSTAAHLPWPPVLSSPEPPFLIGDHVQERSFLFPNSLPPLPPPPAFYHELYMGQPAQPDHPLLGFMNAGAGINYTDALVRGRGMMLSACSPSSSTFPFGSGLHAELAAAGARMTHQEIMDAKALAASKSHSEAERRRRERINAHLARLRSLLPSTTKTDKASLLAEVVQHVKELKRQTSEIAEETSPLPTETDELTIDAADDAEGRFVVRASLCCDDRSDLLPDLIKALKALRLRALKAEITTLGGRIKHVLVVTGEDSEDEAGQLPHYSIEAIQEALKAVMERTPVDEPPSAAAGGTKRQRTAPTNMSTILEHRSI